MYIYIYNDNVFVLKTAVPLYENQPIKGAFVNGFKFK